MNITAVYYAEVNITCVIVLLLFKTHLRQNSEKYSTSNKIFQQLMWMTILLCISDMLAGILRGHFFPGARILIEAANLLFYESMAAVSFLWMIYVFVRIGKIKKLNKDIFLWSIPLILFSLVVITNPFTNFLFIIDENNLFHRNWATYLHWIVSWLYLVVPTLVVAIAAGKEKNSNRRKELIPFLYFIIAPAVAGVAQMLFYGVTSSQVGATISIVIIALTAQSNKIFSDSLTGLNNRHSFNEYIASHFQRHTASELSLLMIDVNNFKNINDRYGHITGDSALKHVAEVLREIAYSTQKKLFVCRYGGDEFIVAAFDCGREEMSRVKDKIQNEFKKTNTDNSRQYDLSVSIGLASGNVADHDDVEHLIRFSDEAMYEEKKLSKIK